MQHKMYRRKHVTHKFINNKKKRSAHINNGSTLLLVRMRKLVKMNFAPFN